jgi:hypothetical protein
MDPRHKMMVMIKIKIMGHECESGMIWGESTGRGGRKERILRE